MHIRTPNVFNSLNKQIWSQPRYNYFYRSINLSCNVFVACRLCSITIHAKAETCLYRVVINKLRVIEAADCFKRCTIHDVEIKNFDSECFAKFAIKDYDTLRLRDFSLLWFNFVSYPIENMYAAALIACNKDAKKLITRLLIGNNLRSWLIALKRSWFLLRATSLI